MERDEFGHGGHMQFCAGRWLGGGCHHFRSNTGDGVTRERRVMTQLKLRQECEAKFKQKCSESLVSVISERVTFNAGVCEMAAGDIHEVTRQFQGKKCQPQGTNKCKYGRGRKWYITGTSRDLIPNCCLFRRDDVDLFVSLPPHHFRRSDAAIDSP